MLSSLPEGVFVVGVGAHASSKQEQPGRCRREYPEDRPKQHWDGVCADLRKATRLAINTLLRARI
jgi:hypothetical protein